MNTSSTTTLTGAPDGEPIPTISGFAAIHNGDVSTSLISGISSIPLQLFSEGDKLTTLERQFLEAAEKGDKATVARCLQAASPVNVNVTNLLGRTALQMAVDNENIEIVELLLAQPNVDIGDALLQAIREGVYKMVEMMVNHPSISRHMLGEGWAAAYKSKNKESSDYSPDISPVILAAHCNQFEILQLLLTRGATIAKPHSVVCLCPSCSEKQKEDSLRYSLGRINSFRALASPAWISMTSSDPVLTAFKLSWELHVLANKENEFKDIFTTLCSQTKEYAVELLEQCRSSEEVIAVLNKESEEDEFSDDKLIEGQLTLARFKLALKYEQKQFVAHPHAQQLMASIWYDGLPGWRRRNVATKGIICLGVISVLPFLVIYYLILPRSRVGELLRSPFMKFLNHSASFLFFLVLLVMASTQQPEDNSRGRQLNYTEGTILVFVLGMIWAECKQLWEEGLKAYIRQWWNWLDFIMLSMYLCTFSLRITASYLLKNGDYDYGLERVCWPDTDPTFLAEGIFAVANVFSFARIIYLFQANPYLGPLQISLGCMLIDIVKFLFIFSLLLISFASGLNKLYTCEAHEENNCKDVFQGLWRSCLTLLWALFGLIGKDTVTITANGGKTIEFFGEFLFLGYQVVAIVVLLNMLIAMMSNSFQNIENHADVEWKFARSKLWMSYFDEGSTLPPPFNLIVSPKSVYYCFQYVKRVLCARKISIRRMTRLSKKESTNGNLRNVDTAYNSNVTPEVRYQDVMKRLVSRYIHKCKARLKADGVNEDDLNEIKQDISSLRYELREDRKREEIRGEGQFDKIKSDIIKALVGNGIKAHRDRNNLLKASPTHARYLTSESDNNSSSSDSRKISPRHRRNEDKGRQTSLRHGHSPSYERKQNITNDLKGRQMNLRSSRDSYSTLPTDLSLTKNDLENMKSDILSSIKYLFSDTDRSNGRHSYHSDHAGEAFERPDSPQPPTPPPPPRGFHPISTSNLNVDIHGLGQSASSPGIRYYLSSPAYTMPEDGFPYQRSFTQI